MDTEIDAVERITQRQQEREETSADIRGVSTLGGGGATFPPGAKVFLLFSLVIILSVAGALTYAHLYAEPSPTSTDDQSSTVARVVPSIERKDIERNVAAIPKEIEQDFTAYSAGAKSHQSPVPEKTPRELAMERKLIGRINNSDSNKQNSTNREDRSQDEKNSRKLSDIEQKLVPVKLEASVAGILPDKDRMITKGSNIPCRLVHRIVTSVPGKVTCTVVRDVHSASGNVVLLDRQTTIDGWYKGGIAQGQVRVFAAFERAELPNGVLINVGSPAAGPLGAAGVSGYIDTHFAERFGGAMMLAVIDDFAASLSGGNDYGSDNQITLNNTSQSAQNMAAEALKNTINIPPTLYKNQGELINIIVARDMDFRSVYDLKIR